MRFASLLSLACLTAFAFAAPIDQSAQDTTVIERSFKNIANNLKGLTAIIQQLDQNSRRGGNTAPQEIEVERRGGDLTNALRDAANQIRRIPVLNTIEATSTIGSVDELTTLIQKTVDAWILAKPSIVRAGGRQTILKISGAQEVACDEFVDSMIAKMPAMSISVARVFGQRARSQVDQAIAAFNRP
jgi:hypothetical protein